MYESEVQQKGYCSTNANLEKVKQLVEELYMPIYQVDHLDSYITESFARAFLLEVKHKKPNELDKVC
jgi:hypothetical protein